MTRGRTFEGNCPYCPSWRAKITHDKYNKDTLYSECPDCKLTREITMLKGVYGKRGKWISGPTHKGWIKGLIA